MDILLGGLRYVTVMTLGSLEGSSHSECQRKLLNGIGKHERYMYVSLPPKLIRAQKHGLKLVRGS